MAQRLTNEQVKEIIDIYFEIQEANQMGFDEGAVKAIAITQARQVAAQAAMDLLQGKTKIELTWDELTCGSVAAAIQVLVEATAPTP